MKQNHTSENLLEFVSNKLEEYNLMDASKFVNFNSNMSKNIDDDIDEVGLLGDVNYLEETDGDENLANQALHDDAFNQLQYEPEIDYSQTQDIVSQQIEMMLEELEQEQTYNQHQLSFYSDNASAFHRALYVLGNFKWFGCAAHHLNLIA